MQKSRHKSNRSAGFVLARLLAKDPFILSIIHSIDASFVSMTEKCSMTERGVFVILNETQSSEESISVHC